LSDDRFDDLAKAAASTSSRRQALKIFGGAVLGGLFLSGGLFSRSRAHAAGQNCLDPPSPCKVNGDCCDTAAGNSCCCRGSKFETTGICTPRDVCVATGGICH
jgi:hypothetical protein